MALADDQSIETRLVFSYGLLFFFGLWGVHRLYLGRYTSGIIYAFTGGLCGLGVLFDIFAIPSMCRELPKIE